ncbi:23 kDa integral membrane protein-like [Anticarsia gemmatalis]|uniref:23 kDa integral membrane protein-like n=1 Tax=Anticarsia gemmatalis TaxID=129554 RepID=UPI003F76DB40
MAAEVNNQKMKFKTETEYNMKSIRFLLLTITAMFIAIGLLMIVLGNSVYAHYHDYTHFYESGNVGRYVTPSALCVFLGLALLIVSMFGFFGSLKRSTCLVNLYAFILLLVFIFKLVIVCLAFTMDSDALLDSLHIPITSITYDPELQAELDFIQSSLGCCGAKDYKDYIGVEFPSNMSTTVVSKLVDGEVATIELPASCCVNADQEFCTKMWSMGCKDALVNVMVQNSIVIGVLGVSVMFINLLGIIFALLLARCIRKMKSEKALMAWKIKEQMIMARQAEEMNKTDANHVYIDHQATSLA